MTDLLSVENGKSFRCGFGKILHETPHFLVLLARAEDDLDPVLPVVLFEADGYFLFHGYFILV